MFLLVKLHIDMRLEAVLPGPQNALYVMYVMYYTTLPSGSHVLCSIFHRGAGPVTAQKA